MVKNKKVRFSFLPRSVDQVELQKQFAQNGDAMARLPHIGLLLILLSVLGCASQHQHQQSAQPVVEKIQEEQPRKPAMPTFTYRPGE
jgi:hypothetical protein